MIVHGLTSTIPIVKKYELNPDGTLQKTPYPFVYDFTSRDFDVRDINAFGAAVTQMASAGGCLIKGALNRSLRGESRAGATNPEEDTSWICLDLDGVQGVQTVDLFLQEIGLGDVDYVLQWSSSMNIENNSGFRCHIFMLLDKPTSPALLKQWLQHINLTSPTLVSSLRLTKTYNSLMWGLDVTTCQNDKLIYVATPHLGPGVPDPFSTTPRISTCIRSRRTATPPHNIPSQTVIRNRIDEKVNELREKNNIARKKPSKYKYSGETEYLAGPDEATITGTKVERGFVYFNLNGGDSWGYYHPEDNPFFIYNFKGEPVYRTQDLLPAYWSKVAQRVKEYKPDTSGTIYLVFRDLITSAYWNGTYNTNTNTLELYKANSREQLHDFMKQRGQPVGDYIPDWTLDFDPHSGTTIDVSTRTINTYTPSETFKVPPRPVSAPPPTINRMVEHFLGSDPATVEHFYNWLAVIVQKLDRTGTAWVLQGIQGTGKGMFFHRVLTPIFGQKNIVSKRVDEIESNFTGYFRNKFIVYIDEMEVGKGEYFSKVTAKLKNIIVEPTISVRPMYAEAVEVRNYANMIFSTNKMQGAQIDMDDRRYNVGFYQRDKLDTVLSDYEIDVLIPSEVESFADYLRSRNADVAKARKPLDNAPRRLIQSIGQTAVDEISMNLKRGNLQYFLDWIVEPEEVGVKRFAAERYKNIIARIQADPSGNTILTREDLHDIMNWLLDGVPQTPVKFASYIKHHDIELTPIWTNGKTIRGIKVNWM